MKNLQLRKLIKESIKQLMTEQNTGSAPTWTFPLNWDGANYQHSRCITDSNSNLNAGAGPQPIPGYLNWPPNGTLCPGASFCTPGIQYTCPNAAYVHAKDCNGQGSTLHLTVELSGQYPQIGDEFSTTLGLRKIISIDPLPNPQTASIYARKNLLNTANGCNPPPCEKCCCEDDGQGGCLPHSEIMTAHHVSPCDCSTLNMIDCPGWHPISPSSPQSMTKPQPEDDGTQRMQDLANIRK